MAEAPEVKHQVDVEGDQCSLVMQQNHFCCPVCLELLQLPVTIPCGHTYCWSCIEKCWDQEESRGRYSCPLCRHRVQQRPELKKNSLMAEVVERLKTTSPQTTLPSPSSASSDVVPCDLCCGPHPNKAAMSCLTCLASYCMLHLEPHSSCSALKTHLLVSATTPVQEKICMKHHKLMDVYCQKDKICICYLCTTDKHKGHEVVSAAAERASEEVLLNFSQKKVKRRFKEREAELKELLQAVTDFKSCSQDALTSTENIFNEMIVSIRKKQTMTKQLIEAQERAAVARAEELQQLLEAEMTNLKQRAGELEKLSHTDDHIHFIQTFQSLSASCESPDLPPGAVIRSKRSFTSVTDGVSKLRTDMENLLTNTWSRITATAATVDVVLPPVPKNRDDYLRYCCALTLNVNSANLHLTVSQADRRVTCEYNKDCYSAHSEDRFTHAMQVLCREGLSERSYWEVRLSGHTWAVAVAYKDVTRTSYESDFGKNAKSWSLACSQEGYKFQHNYKSKVVQGPKCSRIGVFLDHGAGILSFYSITDKKTLLHTERTSFTQPLYPGLGLKETRGSLTSRPCAELMKLW